MTDAARIAAKIALLAFLVSSMLAAGLSLTPHAILAPLRNLRLVLVALALNFVAAPVFALVLSIVIPLERPHAIGLVLLGGAAGAPFLPKLVEGAHGDLGFAVALMTLLTVGDDTLHALRAATDDTGSASQPMEHRAAACRVHPHAAG